MNANLADTDEFMMGFQRVVTEWAWGYAWSRPARVKLGSDWEVAADPGSRPGGMSERCYHGMEYRSILAT